MNDTLRLIVWTMGFGRIALGLAPFVAAGALSRMLGFPSTQDSPTARLMARFFGVRDVGLGFLVFYALLHAEAASFLFLFNALTDAGDLASTAIPLVKRQGIDRAATMSALFAITACIGWFVVWGLSR